jgi:hypothetical protein
MRRGHALATVLAELLAGKDGHRGLRALALDARPGLRPEERVRLALDQVEGRRRLLDAEDDAYGRCVACGEELGLPALEELPWADRCRRHEADPAA